MKRGNMKYRATRDQGNHIGFTLIEMSIVLVIIGLIVGSVLVGRDLVSAAYVRAQVTQIEKFNTATNTFYGKYGALPGDLNDTTASTFGFTRRGPNAPGGSGTCLPACGGQGDGNGIIEGQWDAALTTGCGTDMIGGETAMFWEDLTTANGMNLNLIEGSFNTATVGGGGTTTVPYASVGLYMPEAKLGRGNYVYVWSGGYGTNCSHTGNNYFGLSVVTSFNTNYIVPPVSGNYGAPGLTVREAYNIDKKMDDGYPQTGRVIALAPTNGGGGLNVGWASNTNSPGTPDTSATSGTQYTCYDNGHTAGAVQNYSLEENSGNYQNCDLSFQFQ
jgi:prepilin-type N-terminal cleavage/methylation domain-containing protein